MFISTVDEIKEYNLEIEQRSKSIVESVNDY